jgi:hypothetical protein
MRAVFHSFVFLLLAATLSAAEPALKVSFADKTLTYTSEEFAALPHSDLTALDAHAQKERHYTGVTVHELLDRAGVPLGEKLRGAALQLVVVLHSRDGYAVSYAVAEFDDAFSSRILLLADKEDGKALADNAAPFRLIAPGDKKGARWARMVNWIEVVSAGTPSTKTKS